MRRPGPRTPKPLQVVLTAYDARTWEQRLDALRAEYIARGLIEEID